MQDNKNYFIEVDQITVYRHEFLVLNNVSLKINLGEWIYFLGPTGSGKSSLLQTLYGVLPLKEGSARVDDLILQDLNFETLPFLRRKLGIVSLDFELLEHLNIEENLDFVLRATDWIDPERRKNRIDQVIQLLHLDKMRLQKAHELSKLNYVRALIARALLNQPSLLLVDEPTSMLDAEATDDILTFLYSFSQASKTTVLFATNTPKITKSFPGKIHYFENGQVSI
ncbi:MAG: ATP-binding cassette domain-containing protein [Aureispira sp.]|nr:ATP-binding cassette domain-containing protein [Aureispira sp.]